MRRWIDLFEAPISIATHDFGRDADGDMYNSFGPKDRKLMKSPKGIAKIKKKWETSVADVNLFLLNTEMSPAGALGYYGFNPENHLSIEAKAVELGFELDPNAINCLLSNNYSGATEHPLTAWMIGHRLWHAIVSKDKFFYHEGYSMLEGNLAAIGRAYGCGDYREVAHMLGRSRACREKVLTNFGELLPETFTEYMLFGKVRLNPLPEMFMDALDTVYHIRADNYGGRHWFDLAEEYRVGLEQELNRHHAEIIKHAIGKAYTF